MVIEVYTPGGNWSSFPPHKHDVHNPPSEADLDEIYYFRFQKTKASRSNISTATTKSAAAR